ncbi:MAG: Uma2 family endonuclease [Thermomicrobiales bacterium]
MVAQPISHPQPDLTVVPGGEQRVVMSNISWGLYEQLLAEDPARRVPRMAFSNGTLEFMTPSRLHDKIFFVTSQIIMTLANAWQVDYLPIGPMTLRQHSLAVGCEPDACFFIQHVAEANREMSPFPEGHPPDLVIEIEVSRTLVARLPILAAMGVPEVWRATADAIDILVLDGGSYRAVEASATLPLLTTAQLNAFAMLRPELSRPDWCAAMHKWAISLPED